MKWPFEIPGELTGSHPLGPWLNKLLRRLHCQTPLPGPGYKIKPTTTGFFLELDPGTGGGGRSALSTYRVKSVVALAGQPTEVLVCRTWDGTTEGTEDVKVAKNFNCRKPGSETIAGVVVAYSYGPGPDTLNGYRQAVGTGINEQQVIVPYYLVNGLISVARTNYSGVKEDPEDEESDDLKLIEVSARCWAGPA